MTGQPGLLGLYWGAREEPFDSCVERLYESLRCLQALGYEQYYERGRSRRDALKRPFEVTPSAVRKKLARGRSHTDVPRRPMLDLGWKFSLWSGGADLESYSLSIGCGAYSEYVGNRFVLKLPPCGAHSIRNSPGRASAAFDQLVTIWKPDKGVLCEGSIEWDGGLIVTAQPPLRIIQPRA